MFGSLLQLAILGGTLLLGIGGYVLSRNFVRRRLRFVDAVRSPLAPIAAGVLAFLIAWPFTLLPLVTATTAVVLGFACAFGTASGVRALRRGDFNSRQLLP
jgi:uncharacterized membrane protein